MKLNRTHIILFILFVLTVALFYFFVPRDRYNWNETYDENADDPYALHVFHDVLRDYFPGEKFVELTDSLSEMLPTDAPTVASSYFFVGMGFFVDNKSMDTLVTFIKNGNTAFISSEIISKSFIEKIFEDSLESLGWKGYAWERDTLIAAGFTDEVLADSFEFSFQYFYKDLPRIRYWTYIPYDYIESDTLQLEEYGYFNDYTNMAGIKVGKGNLILHTTPLLFTNLALIEDDGLEYVSRACAYLPEGTIYWDKVNRNNKMNPWSNNMPNASFNKDGPLRYILSQPPLAWAWYIGLVLVLMFVVFRAKRKQRIIPVLEKNTNTSLEFIATIGQLSFQNHNHKALSLQQVKLFKTYVWQHYHVSTRKIDEQMMQTLHQKSNVPIEIIEKIFTLAKNIKSAGYVSENTLMDLHHLLENFYKTSQ